MLTWIRKKKDSKVVKYLLLTVALTFLGGFGVIGYLQDWFDAGSPKNAVIVVAGEQISTQEFMQAMRNSARDTPTTDEEYASLKQRVLDRLVTDRLLNKKAEELGLKVSDEELKMDIRSYSYYDDNRMRVPLFLTNGVFDKQKYSSFLKSNRISSSTFEESRKKVLLRQKVIDLVLSQASVSEAEIMDEYVRDNTKVDIKFVAFDPEKFTISDEIPVDEMAEYFNDNKSEFYMLETRKVEYILVSLENARKTMEITDEDIEDYYNSHKEKDYVITPKEVRARHILIKPEPASVPEDIAKNEQAALDKIKVILDQARSPGGDFAALASEYSDDPGSKVRGGDLGFFKTGVMVKPFEEAAFATPVGAISEPVKSVHGYHIIKVEEIKEGEYKKFDKKLKAEIKAKILETEAGAEATGIAKGIRDKVSGDTKWEDVAKEKGFEIKTSGFFQSSDLEFEDMDNAVSVITAAFKTEKDKISSVISINDVGAVLFKVVELKEPHQPEFDEVKKAVRNKLLQIKRKEAAKKAAEDMLASLKEGNEFEKLAENSGLEPMLSGPFKFQYGIIPKIGIAEDMSTAAFMATEESPYPNEIYEISGKFYVFRLESREEADTAALDKEKMDEIYAKLLPRKQSEILKRWTDNLKAVNSSEIIVNKSFDEI